MADIIPPRRNEFITPNGIPTQRFIEYLEGIARNLNSSNKEVENVSSVDNATTILSSLIKRIRNLELILDIDNSGKLADIIKKINDIELISNIINVGGFEDFKIRSTATDTTTTGKEIIICTNTSNITVTLNPAPNDKERVHIVRQSTGGVIVLGGINGANQLNILNRYDAPYLIYTTAAGEWSLI